MSYHLASLRLCSIGASHARFSDLTVSTLGVDGTPQDHIVWLRNGGGKSTLLTLLYALLLPRKLDFMGRVKGRELADYVDAKDTSHTIAVWHPATTGTLDGSPEHILVTGAVYEWKDLRKPSNVTGSSSSSSSDDLAQTYYAFFASPGIFDDTMLPITDEGGYRVRRSDFIGRLRAQAAQRTGSDFALVDKNFGDWERALTARGLDPELFRSQKQMNHVEGDVEKLFTFRNPKEFIDFLLKLTVSPDVTDRIADSVGMIADKISQKPDKQTERKFCLTAAEGLRRLAGTYASHTRRAEELAEATVKAAALSAQFAASVRAARRRRTGIEQEKEERSAEQTRRSGERNTSASLAALYRRRSAELGVAEAQQRLERAENVRDRAHRSVKVWQVAARLAEHREVADGLAEARARAAEEVKELAPLALIHDQHLAAYKALLAVLAEDAATRAHDASTSAAREAEAAVEAEQLADLDRAAAADAKAEAGALQVQLDLHAEQLKEAVRHKALPDVATDPAAHAVALEADRDRSVRDLKKIQDRRAGRPEEHEYLNGHLRILLNGQAQADNELAQLRSERDRHETEAERLASGARVMSLAEASPEDPVNLWAEAETLVNALKREIQRSDSDLINEKVSLAAADRTIAFYDESGFLPSTLDADRVVGLLTGQGIEAEPGWAHLRSVLTESQLLEALADPALSRIGAGVVVPTDMAGQARVALAAAGETTIALVEAFTAAAAGVAAASRGGFDTAPVWSGLAPGLVQRSAAGMEVDALVAVFKEQVSFSADLTAAREADAELLRDILAFLLACPAGSLAETGTRITAGEARCRQVTEDIAANSRAQNALALGEADDMKAEAELALRILNLGKSLLRLESPIRSALRLAEWEGARDAAALRQEELSARAGRSRAEAKAASARDRAFEVEAGRLDSAAGTYLSQAQALSYIGEPGRLPEPGDVTGQTLEILRSRTEEARYAHDVPASRFRSAARADALAGRLAQLGAGLPTDPVLLSEAGAILSTPDGQSAQNRSSALDAAEDARTAADESFGQARHEVTTAKDVLEKSPEPRPVTRPFAEPESSAQASRLATEQEEIATRARQLEASLGDAIRILEDEERDLEGLSKSLHLLAFGLPEPVESGPAAKPFDGGLEAGEKVKGERLAELAAARSNVTATEHQLAEDVGKLRLAAADFPNVSVKARDRLRLDEPPELAAKADKYAGELSLRAAQIDSDLASIAADQAIVAQTLAGVVSDNFDMFRRTQKYSVLPDGLGGLSGRQLLKIKFMTPPEDSLRAHVERVIEDAVTKGNKPDGLSLLMASTHAAVGARGFTVKVLKPVQDLIPTEEDVSALSKWSGGEHLTAGVALYCTIAKVRAVSAGQKEQSGGVLILDNPIGRASHGPMVEVQRRVATAQGVQLIYATGLQDFAAVSQFPTITRLDNRRGSGSRYKIIVRTDEADLITGARLARIDRLQNPAVS